MPSLLMVSGDSYGKVHFREWKLGKNMTEKVLANTDWDEEFERMLEHYESNGHKVVREYGEFDERLISVIRIDGSFDFIRRDDNGV